MPGRAYLHIGAPKTGTTFLQGLLWREQRRLAEHGVLLPGRGPNDHFRAGFDLCGVGHDPLDPQPDWQGAWSTLAAELRDATAPVAMISDERLASASAGTAEHAVRTLHPREVHVIYTVRDFGRLLLAEWQEFVKDRYAGGIDEWCATIFSRDTTEWPGSWFWAVHDVAGVLARWGAAVPAERIHVVVVPSPAAGPAELWRRFAGALDPPLPALDTGGVRRNASLGVNEVEVLRSMNARLPGDYPKYHYVRLGRELLAHRVLAAHDSRVALQLPAGQAGAVRAQAEAVIDAIGRFGGSVAGALDELRPDESVLAGEVSLADAAVVAGEAADCLAALLEAGRRDSDGRREQLRRTCDELGRTQAELAASAARVEALEAMPAGKHAKLAARRYGERRPAVGAVLEQVRRARRGLKKALGAEPPRVP
jgi:hypothetical protein